MDYSKVLLGPAYKVLSARGVTLTLLSGTVFQNLRARDLTIGVQLPGTVADLETLRPMASMLVADLIAIGVDPSSDLDAATLVLNGKTWTVNSVRMMPSPAGEADGEVYLMLEGTSG